MTRDEPKTALKETREIIDVPFCGGAVLVNLPEGSSSVGINC